MLVAYTRMSVTKLDFIFKKNCPQNGSKIKFFEFIKRFDLNLTNNKSLYICYIAAQNPLGQPDCMIISNTSLEQSDEIFFPC